MHELAITQSIFNQAIAQAKKHKAKQIKKIKLQIGEASAIVADCVQFYFDTLKKGTIAEKCVLEFELVPIKLICPECKKEIIVPHMSLRGSDTTEAISKIEIAAPSARNDNLELPCDCKKGVEIVSGNDMIIEYIDVE